MGSAPLDKEKEDKQGAVIENPKKSEETRKFVGFLKLPGKTRKAVKSGWSTKVHKSPQESADFGGKSCCGEWRKRTPTRFDKESKNGAFTRKTEKDVKFRIFRNVPQSYPKFRKIRRFRVDAQQNRTRAGKMKVRQSPPKSVKTGIFVSFSTKSSRTDKRLAFYY